MEIEALGQGMDAAKEAVAWVSGITGLSSIVVILIGLKVGSAIIKGIVKLLLAIAIIAAGLFLWAQMG